MAKRIKLDLSKEEYDLLCECIRYRSADNQAEWMAAERKGLSEKPYRELSTKLDNLKKEIYGKDTRS